MLNVGLLGAGRIGAVHARTIATHPGSRLAAISDAITESAAALAAKMGAEPRSTEAILADTSIDAVLIATPTNTHSDLIEAATGGGSVAAGQRLFSGRDPEVPAKGVTRSRVAICRGDVE
ncbi:Gfo/Idh/MocA family oxidoreductase, partial [Bradyrhizobium sp.]|uniref:Gfo/Idh/MocA family oxidoreductase n=1 Tax=Bradyrhizobium sp. TaxID=376 RepID=UPI00391ABC04